MKKILNNSAHNFTRLHNLNTPQWDILGYSKKPKVSVNHIVNLLKPPSLKRVKEDQGFSQSELEKDWKGFLKQITTRELPRVEL